MRRKTFAIFIAYKASKTLEKFYADFPKELFDEIILVDDASGDGTFELARKLGIESFRNEKNLGYGGNMKRAIDIALNKGADVIVDIHPDGEYLPGAIPSALELIDGGADFVLGNRFASGKSMSERGMFFWKILPVTFLNWLARTVLRIKIHDLHQGFRVYTRRLLETANYKANANDYLFSFELIAQASLNRLKIDEVPVETKYEGKKRGASLKNSIKYSLGTFKVLAQYLLAKCGLPAVYLKKSVKDFGIINGNVHTDAQFRDKKNWVVGHFMDSGAPFLQTDFSLKWTKTAKGDKRNSAALFEAETLDILAYGKHKINFPDLNTSVTLEHEGDYLYFAKNVAHTWETLEDSLVVTLRWPSSPPKERK